MPITNEEIYEKLLDIEKRIFQIEQKIGVSKKPDVFEYEQKIKPVQFNQQPIPKQKNLPVISEEVKQVKIEHSEKKKKTEKETEDIVSSIKEAFGFV